MLSRIKEKIEATQHHFLCYPPYRVFGSLLSVVLSHRTAKGNFMTLQHIILVNV